MPAVDDIGHAVQFYREDVELCDTVGTYLAEGIRDWGVSVVVATEAHRRGFADALVAAGIDPLAAREDGQLLSLDAPTTLARVIRRGRVDRAAFSAGVSDVLRHAAERHGPVRVYGEMVCFCGTPAM
jgi:hypothetical protein